MEIHFNAPIFYTKFRLDPSMRLCFIAIFLVCEKTKKKKRRNLNKTLCALISKMDEAICIKFGM